MNERTQNRLAWLVACILAALTLVAYGYAGRAAGGGEPLMPLDDTYIHFQYARQLAGGQPFVYNPGYVPTSGATSFLYPFILAAGTLIGFRDLNLGVWAMIVGALAFAGAIYLVYRIGRLRAPFVPALLIACAFGIHGAFAWHAMSGMETLLVVFALLLTLFMLVRGSVPGLAFSAALLALLRPEGGAWAVIAVLGSVFGVLGSQFLVLSSQFSVLSSQFSPPGSHTEPGTQNSEPRTQNPELRTQNWELRTFYALPLLALAVQPVVNWLVTGTAVATGNQAKSLLAALASPDEIARRIIDNFVRMWREWWLPTDTSVYVGIVIAVLAVVGIIRAFSEGKSLFKRGREEEEKRKTLFISSPLPLLNKILSVFSVPLRFISQSPYRLAVVVILLWLLAGAAAISTLDTAFWHFKRYQMPLIALLFPLAAWGMGAISRQVSGIRYQESAKCRVQSAKDFVQGSRFDVPSTGNSVARTQNTEHRTKASSLITHYLVPIVAFASLLPTVAPWLGHYALNVGYVYAQPYQMARWLAAHTETDAVIAVHDVGMMRYVGGRTTLDIVGLTTPGAAEFWRQGPGAIGQFLMRQRPDYIAAYGEGHGLGLGYLQSTGLYADPLATFSVALDPVYNVALAAPTQGIYRPDWTTATPQAVAHQRALMIYTDIGGIDQVDQIDVGDVANERAHDYRWRNARPTAGFPTEFYQFGSLDCAVDCTLMDGGRRINGEESFTLSTQPNRALFLLTRLHAGHPGEFDVYVGDTLVATRVIPHLPGAWYEVLTYIPAERVTDERTHIRIVPRLPAGDYMPYMHWALQSRFPVAFAVCGVDAQATYQDGVFSFNDGVFVVLPDRLEINFNWMNGEPGQPQARGDYVLFVHVLAADGGIVAQTDTRPANGTLPPGNWLPSMLVDTIVVDLHNIPAGTYAVAIGWYDPQTFERLLPTLTPNARAGTRVSDDGRLFIGTITVPESWEE
jgi:hypothetical protein